ncbi:MAG: nucleotide disphospho-sugar-binding domain-containing protein, partial [Chthoniobacterales bacterium]
IGFSAAEKLAVPVIGAGMIPLTPTSAFPSPFLPPRSMPRWLNPFSYGLVAEVLWRSFRKATNAARAKVGLPPGRKIWLGHSNHGGSGTTHSAARAGVPSIVLPFAADQFFWAEQLRRVGIAPAAASGPKVTAHILSRAVDVAQTAEMRERASAVGATMRTEDGLAKAVDRIHALRARSLA